MRFADEQYWQAIARASYYAWAARKNFPVHRDPLTGRQNGSTIARRAERAANVAQARVWYAHAASWFKVRLP